MDNQSEVIQQQMEETRSALQDKLETLEQQVKNTVQDATEAVSDTVESVKDAVQETVDTVKDTVHGTVQSVKETFDLPRHVETHPWAMFLGAAAVGFVATRCLTPAGSRPPGEIMARKGNPSEPTHRNGSSQPRNGVAAAAEFEAPQQPAAAASKGNWLADHYKEELAKAKGLAFGVIGGVVREMLTSAVAPAMAEQIKEIVNSVTVKMGGHLIDGPILQPAKPRASTAQPAPEGYRDSIMGRLMDAGQR